MKTEVKKEALKSAGKIQLQATAYGLIGIAAVFLIAYAITGSVFRSFLLIIALALAAVTFNQANRLNQTARLTAMKPYIKDFDDEMRSVINEALAQKEPKDKDHI